MQYLGKYDGPKYAQLDVDIDNRIACRKQKYPDCDWCSAVGRDRE